MAATATAQFSNTQTSAASTLRQNQTAARRAQPGVIGRMSEYATKNVRAGFLGASLMMDSGFGRGAELEDVEGGDQIENVGGGGGGGYTAGLSDQARFAEAEQKQKILRATTRDVAPDYAFSEEAREEQEYYVQMEQAIRQQSLDMDVAELGVVRQMKQRLADQAAEAAAEKAKSLAVQLVVAGAEDVAGDLADVTDVALVESDFGLGTVLDMTYKAARVGNSVLPRPSDVGESGGDAAAYAARKAVDYALPPYVPFNGTLWQKLSFIQFLLTYGWIPIALTLFIFAIGVMVLVAYVITSPGSIIGFPSLS
jgi:hypothetical protein